VDRRIFLRSAGLATAGLALHRPRAAAQTTSAAPWRTFEVITRVEVLEPVGVTRVWVPTPLSIETPYQRPLGTSFDAGKGKASLVADKGLDAVGMVSAEFGPGVPPVLVVTSRVATRDHAVNVATPGHGGKENRAVLEHFLQPSRLVRTDGIVRKTALSATEGKRTDLEKARAIYDWIVENTFRDPKVLGCGTGDIHSMLEKGNLGGKCADLNALYVGLARAAGLPARDVYGIRTAKSERGYKSLGPASSTITKSQHCRAEVYLDGYGWVPVDPADVRKVMLEEPPGNRPLADEMVARARERLFGSWEMNWMAYNYGHDVRLPGSKSEPVGYLMYVQAETERGRKDPYSPDSLKYEITSTEVSG
jgi:transglutaminase-like putative cysteine protease